LDALIGRTVGRYRIVAELARGGMGVVYRALDTTLNREVALKVLPPDVVTDPDRRRRFLREAQTASQLEHAHIGVIHEVGEADGVSFIAMELLRGDSLATVISGRGLTTSRALELAAEIAEGLARAHDQGVIHRDLKPANVMVTDDGHAKIIDFGLAKAIESETTPDAATIAASTDLGSIKGTAAYMSPEQTRGAKLDARSDVFSFGVVLYQMLSGRLPFQAPSYVDTLHAIVHDPAPPLTLAGSNVPVGERDDLQRILDKCLAKDPAARYQTVRDLVVDLRDARRRLDSGITSTVARPATGIVPVASSQSRWRPLLFGLAAVIVAAVGVGYWWTHRGPAAPPPIASSGRPSVAVLYFQNNTGSSQLDWLRTGLTDMVVTDLSQSSEFDVLGTDRLYQILASLKRQNDAVISFDTVREVARLAGVRHVLVGNYVKSGDTLRINITLQEADSGRIVTAEHFEAAGESNLFPTVDDLTRKLQTHLAATIAKPTPLVSAPGVASGTSATNAGLYRDLQDVTTKSIDAYRVYAQGVALLERGQAREAEPLLVQAITIDPNFALAMARLAAVENNLRRLDEKEKYAKRSLDHADRLTLRDRYYLEGFYYSSDEETVERGIAGFEKLLQLYPQHYAGKHNLANTYDELELFADSVRLGEELKQNAFVLPISLTNLADSYASLDQFDKTMATIAELEGRAPDNSFPHERHGDMFLKFDKLSEARAEYERADAMGRQDPTELSERSALAILEQRWSDVEALTTRQLESEDPFTKYAGNHVRAISALYHGRSVAALQALNEATRAPGTWGPTFDGMLQIESARLNLSIGQPARALVAAQAARKTPGQNLLTPVAWSRYYLAIALTRLGRAGEASAPIKELSERATMMPGPRIKRMSQELQGVLALDRRDTTAAVSSLLAAEGLLSPRYNYGPPPPGPAVWFALGSAYLAAGNDTEAEKRFTRLTTTVQRVMFPIEYVRSLYFLGQIAERRGDVAKSRDYYQQFVTYWGDGDIDRDKVAEAKKRLK
jgi:serine/threonine protein kinase/tetratricopeptide (TPR) repeat protein